MDFINLRWMVVIGGRESCIEYIYIIASPIIPIFPTKKLEYYSITSFFSLN